MAHVSPHSNQIKGTRYVTTIDLKPTKAGLAAAKRQSREAEQRLRLGEEWVVVRAWLRGERAAPPKSLGYYAQHLFNHSDVEGSTLSGYRAAYKRYWSAFAERSIVTLSKSELQAHLAKFEVTRKTKRNALSVLRRVFEVAKGDRVLTETPLDDWEFKKGQDPEPDPYTDLERDKLLVALKPWPIAWRYFLMAFHSGMRTGELLGVEWRTLDKPYARVVQSRVRREIKLSTKTDSHRAVSLPPLVWKMLEANPTRFRKSFVFLTPKDHAFRDADWLMDKWSRAHKASAVRRRNGPYPWRSTYISLALSNGATPMWVAKQAGHDILTMNKHYARWIEGQKDADLKELEKIYQ